MARGGMALIGFSGSVFFPTGVLLTGAAFTAAFAGDITGFAGGTLTAAAAVTFCGCSTLAPADVGADAAAGPADDLGFEVVGEERRTGFIVFE